MSKFTAVGGDVFAGAFSYGIRMAGFDVPIHLENINYGVDTAQLNFPHTEFRVGAENWHPEKIKGVDLLFSNPPCAPWSNLSAGRACTWDKDPRLSCIDNLMDAALKMKVKTYIWESVTVAWGKGRSFVDERAKMFIAKGYHVTILIQNNLYLGAPQNRRRMLFIAHKHPLVWPKLVTKHPTIGEVLKGTKAPEKEKIWLKPGDKLLWEKANQPSNRGKWSAVYRDMTPTQQKKIHCKPSFLSNRLNRDEISNVFFPGHSTHPDEPRRLSYSESLALCGLPQTWKVANTSFGYVAGILVRTVLAPVGTWIGLAVKDGLAMPPLKGKPKYTLVTITSPEIKTEELTHA